MIPKRTKDTDIASEIAQGKHFRKKIMQLAEDAATRFINGEALNSIIASIAQKEQFNQVQIQRLVEETNTVAYNKRYALVKSGNDRRISFELAELARVIEEMGDAAPPAIDNPNWVKGKPGEGEIKKTASAAVLHNPNASISKSRERLEKKASEQQRKELEKQARFLNRDIESGIFKIAQSIVQSEKVHKNGNEIFNTMLSQAPFSDTLTDGIMKKASELADHLVKTRRVHSGFEVDLKVDLQEKVASTFLGKYSLNKIANDNQLVAQPKVMPIHDVKDYQQLISLAKEIQAKQVESLEVENKIQ